MNQRIRQLLEQAKTESSQWLGSKPATTITYDELEKFAELIVKQCAGIYSKIDNGNLHMGTDNYLEALHKTFFGVEE